MGKKTKSDFQKALSKKFRFIPWNLRLRILNRAFENGFNAKTVESKIKDEGNLGIWITLLGWIIPLIINWINKEKDNA